MTFDARNVLQEGCFCIQLIERCVLKAFGEVRQRKNIRMGEEAQRFDQQAFCAAEGAQPLMDDSNFLHHRIIVERMNRIKFDVS